MVIYKEKLHINDETYTLNINMAFKEIELTIYEYSTLLYEAMLEESLISAGVKLT